MEVLDNLWSFNFHKGKAFKTAIVRAKDERTAIQVAAEWCRQNGYRAPAGILPMVVADEGILPPGVGEVTVPEKKAGIFGR